MPVSYGLKMLRIYELTELPGLYDLCYGTRIWRIPQH